ncbi:MAG: hypothetical protein HQL23_08570 [Candidatus Omnitrophica bacterium]|nr:hypothetical protein [Candidatus Omnitrophota bacterium]
MVSFPELDALGVDRQKIQVDTNDGYPRIAFDWQYPGSAGSQKYAITFINGDITQQAKPYPEKLQNVLQNGIDVYYQRAGVGIGAYAQHPPFIKEIYKHMRAGGSFVTDDFYITWNEVYDGGSEFPADLALSEMPIPGEGELIKEISDMRLKWEPAPQDLKLDNAGGHPNLYYGWKVRVRQKTSSPVSVPAIGRPTSALGISTPDKLGGIDFKDLKSRAPNGKRSVGALKGQLTALPISQLEKIDIFSEWSRIQNLVNEGVIPSNARMKQFLMACCQKQVLGRDLNKILGCLSDIFRLEETQTGLANQGQAGDQTDPLKDMLAQLETNRTPQEILAGLSLIALPQAQVQLSIP